MKNYKELQIVYGGQWGSEGKGQIATYLARTRETKFMVAVRVGGPNAGHTFTAANGEVLKVQQIPCSAFASSFTIPVIGVSGMIIPELLKQEIEMLQRVWDGKSRRVVIDGLASVITPADMHSELGLKTRIGSTGEGVGAATAKRVMRKGITFAEWLSKQTKRDRTWFSRFIEVGDTQNYLTRYPETIQGEATLQLEGTQGYMLSLNAGRYYPYCTSRDCGPDAIAAQCGISTRIARRNRIVCVMRTFPIRVGGNSGPMGEEIGWDTLMEETGGYVSTPEITTVTKKQRRIARWDDNLAHRIGVETHPTEVAITFADYMYPALHETFMDYGSIAMTRFSKAIPEDKRRYLHMLENFLSKAEAAVGAPVTMYSVGPGMIVDRMPEYSDVAKYGMLGNVGIAA